MVEPLKNDNGATVTANSERDINILQKCSIDRAKQNSFQSRKYALITTWCYHLYIFRNADIVLAPRSQDWSVLNVFLLDYFKHLVCQNLPRTIVELKRRITIPI